MKKFFIFVLSLAMIFVLVLPLGACSENEIDRVSKNLTSYAISARLDDDTKQISAKETIIFYNNSASDLEYICLHLYPRAFRENATIKPYTALTEASCFPNGVSFGDLVVLKVSINAETKEFELVGEDEDILKINFGFKLTPKKSVEVVIEFNLIIPNSTHRLGYFEKNINLGNWYPIVSVLKNGEFDTAPYYSTGDPFYSEIANYDIEIKFPAKYQICATGNVEAQNEGEVMVAKISAKAVRDFAMVLSANASTAECKTDEGAKILYMAPKEDENILCFAELAKDAVEFFGKMFGSYPYSTLSVVKTPFIYGGMEYPNIVFISDSIDDEEEKLKVIVHEIAHQWWYGIVGNNEVKEAWLDESLSEYSTALFFKYNDKYKISYDEFVGDALSSYLLYVDVIQTIRGEVNTKMNLCINEYQNDYEYSYMVYVKGVIMFDSLKNMVGEKSVVSGLRKYYKNNKFKIASSDDFFEAFDEACHKDLKTFFDGFLFGTTIISSIN